MKLNLGCFNKKLPGFINVDIRQDVNPDIIDNAFTLEKFANNSVDLIYASHILEHLNYQECITALNRWREVLKNGGILRIAVPNMEAVFAHYFYHKNLKLLLHTIYGSQKHDFDFHKNGFDFELLKETLESQGYHKVKLWDWKTTNPHYYCDDYSQAYWPHMDKENGKLMSLNVECEKK